MDRCDVTNGLNSGDDASSRVTDQFKDDNNNIL